MCPSDRWPILYTLQMLCINKMKFSESLGCSFFHPLFQSVPPQSAHLTNGERVVTNKPMANNLANTFSDAEYFYVLDDL